MNNSAYKILGNTTQSIRYVIILAYFSMAALALYLIQWHFYNWFSFLLVVYLGTWGADFVGGLVHLFIDYRPLNFTKGFDRLYQYQGDRGSKEFIEMKAEVMKSATSFDHLVYSFKVHHRDPGSNRNLTYSDFFMPFVSLALIGIGLSMFISLVFSEYAWAAYFALFEVILSVGSLHSDHIHVCTHGSLAMPRGTKFVRFLQKCRLIYAYKTHALHHKDGRTGFCFVTGHANFAVNWICRQLLARGMIHSEDWFGVPRQHATE